MENNDYKIVKRDTNPEYANIILEFLKFVLFSSGASTWKVSINEGIFSSPLSMKFVFSIPNEGDADTVFDLYIREHRNMYSLSPHIMGSDSIKLTYGKTYTNKKSIAKIFGELNRYYTKQKSRDISTKKGSEMDSALEKMKQEDNFGLNKLKELTDKYTIEIGRSSNFYVTVTVMDKTKFDFIEFTMDINNFEKTVKFDLGKFHVDTKNFGFQSVVNTLEIAKYGILKFKDAYDWFEYQFASKFKSIMTKS